MLRLRSLCIHRPQQAELPCLIYPWPTHLPTPGPRNTNNDESEDPFYPASGSSDAVDSCLDHPQGDGILHYHSMSGWVGGQGAGIWQQCRDVMDALVIRPQNSEVTSE
jgi:hypothetical protein